MLQHRPKTSSSPYAPLRLPTSLCPHLPLSLLPLHQLLLLLQSGESPHPPGTGRDKRPDSPAEHCPLSPSVPSCTAMAVELVVLVVAAVGASGENPAWSGTNI